jgi:hypothetical protein
MWSDDLVGASDAIVFVEGESDRLAVEAVAARLGHDLAAAGATVVSMHGITNLHHHLARLSQERMPRRIVGLFDIGEIAYVRSAVAGAGLAPVGADLATIGFFACDPDLEGELIRALGSERVEHLLAEHGELARFRTFQNQPYQRARPVDAQLRRFMGTHSGRKARFAPIFVGALDDARIPAVFTALVAAAVGTGTGAQSRVAER